jgi:antitoxin component YwqK of YwqJK toxin-antitoxin module
VNYNNGLLEGNYQNFTRKGNIISETNYKNNRKHGDVKIYSKRGKLISHIVYKDGIKVKDVINKINFKYNSPTKKK